jgi:hypothetical protein
MNGYQSNYDSKTALADRTFSKAGLQNSAGTKNPLGSSGASHMDASVVARETELRAGSIVNNTDSDRSEFNYNVMKRTTGANNVRASTNSLGVEYRFK